MPQARPIDMAQLQLVIDACGDDPHGRRDAALVLVMREAMLRAGEAAALRWDQIQQTDTAAVIEPGSITITPECAALLEQWRAACGDVQRRTSWQLVFGLSDRSIRYVVNRAGRRAGIDWLTGDSPRYGLMDEHRVLASRRTGSRRYISPEVRQHLWQALDPHPSEPDRRRCPMCGRHKYRDDFDVDHRVPFAEGGTSDIDNLQMVCVGCHRRKHT